MNDKILTPSEIESLRKNKSDSYHIMLDAAQQKKMVEALNRVSTKLKNCTSQELKDKIKESQDSLFAKTINELIEFSKTGDTLPSSARLKRKSSCRRVCATLKTEVPNE